MAADNSETERVKEEYKNFRITYWKYDGKVAWTFTIFPPASLKENSEFFLDCDWAGQTIEEAKTYARACIDNRLREAIARAKKEFDLYWNIINAQD